MTASLQAFFLQMCTKFAQGTRCNTLDLNVGDHLRLQAVLTCYKTDQQA
jgi:hypothetical protein